jgi:N-acetylglucosaminyldiphosphoundecaprenol N-acetyl-beta-D-mannosaminyltransferase
MKCVLGGISLDDVNMSEAVAEVARMARQTDRPRLVCTANLDHLVSATRDPGFLNVYRSADLVLADGMPLIWLSKLTALPLRERVAGSDLFWELGRASSATGMRLFFLGGQAGAADKAANALRQRFPNACVVGTYFPPFGSLDNPEEFARIRAAITMAEPDVLLVAFGSPRQEKWIAAHQEELGVPVSIGVGASFDMAAGMVRRAPLWMQKRGLEWLFRTMQEPARLAHRYLGKDLPYFCTLLGGLVWNRLTGAYKRPGHA